MLVKEYSHRIYSYSLNFSGSRQFAEEATQEAFFRIFKSIDRIEANPKIFELYLYKTAKNICIDNYRKHKGELIVEEQDFMIPKWDPDYATKELVWRALNSLPQEERNLMIMREIEGLSYEEIATMENIPLGTLKSRLNRIKIKLAEILQKLEKRG